jgi:hypothetical protein
VLLLFRPEDIRISHAEKGTRGLITDGHYEGGRWQWQVEVGDDILTLWAQVPPPIGEVVGLEVINPPSLFSGGA